MTGTRCRLATSGTAVTHLRIGAPHTIGSHAWRRAEPTGLLSCERADEYLLTITFDDAASG